MNKLSIILAVVMSLLGNVSNSQNLISVQNGGTLVFYQQVNDAILNSQDGDTIYIPGGSFSISASINKKLHLVGVGHNPDSTLATNRTYFFGNLYLISGANGGSLTGILIPGDIKITYTLSGYHISRCNIGNIASVATWAYAYAVSNFVVTESVIGLIYFVGGQGNALYNNILGTIAGVGTNGVFKNNILLQGILQTSYDPGYFSYSTFENNIFLASNNINSLNMGIFNNNSFNNNLFVENVMFPFSTNIGINNIVNQPPESIFINQSGSSFSYSQDYHLKATCPGKNAGRDGTDIGIYGGAFPWKTGSIPFNPHFQTAIISPTTNSSGNLNVNIKVAAQDH